MAGIKQIDQSDVLIRYQIDFQFTHEPAGGEPEIIAHQHESLDPLTVALTQSGDQVRVRLTALGMEPLLELIQDQQHLPPGRQQAAYPHVHQRIDQPQTWGQFRTRLTYALEQPSFGLLRGGLDVNREDVLAQPGQESRLDQRRFPAARGAVDQTDLERPVGVDWLDPSLPELEAVRQSVAIPRSGEQFHEEVGIMLIERAQPSRDDLDRGQVRIGLAGWGPGW